MKYYVLLEWYGNGSGEITEKSHDKKYLLSLRQRTYTANESLFIYDNPTYFFSSDVPESEILTYKCFTDYKKGKEPIEVEHWF